MLDLDAIQALADEATEGPWAWEATGEKDNSWAVGQIQDDDGEPVEGENEPGANIVIDGVCEGIDGHIPDAAFIAWCREGVPALVAALRAARALRDDVGVALAMKNGMPYLKAAAGRYDRAIGGDG